MRIFTDFAECDRHIADPTFRRALRRFVRRENREVLFRDREYSPRDCAYLSSGDFRCSTASPGA